jgi:hypothetical protein
LKKIAAPDERQKLCGVGIHDWVEIDRTSRLEGESIHVEIVCKCRICGEVKKKDDYMKA